MSDQVSKPDIVRMLRTAVDEAGGVRKFADKRNISASLISDTLSGRRDVSTTIATTVGYMPVTRFEPIRRRANAS